jgi:quinol monooxygenase YgiN
LNHSYLDFKPQLSIKQASWLQRFTGFDFEIIYRPGSRNPADGLLKRSDHFKQKEKQSARDQLLPKFLKSFKEPLAKAPCNCSYNLSRDPTAQQQHCPIGVSIAAIRHGIPERKRSLGEHPPKDSSKAEASYLLNRNSSSLANENSGNNLAEIIRKNQQANAFVINEKWQQRHSRNVAGNPF